MGHLSPAKIIFDVFKLSLNPAASGTDNVGMERAVKNPVRSNALRDWLLIGAMCASFVAYLLCSRAIPIFWDELTRLLGKL